jgi:hypothetical protein
MSSIPSWWLIMRCPDKSCLAHSAACSDATVSSRISGYLHSPNLAHTQFGLLLKTRWHGVCDHAVSHSSAGFKRSLYTSKSVGSNSSTAPAMSGAE